MVNPPRLAIGSIRYTNGGMEWIFHIEQRKQNSYVG